MDTLTIIGWFLSLWGLATLWVALLKPKPIWRMGKIQGFVQLFTETGAVIFFAIVGLAALAGGLLILF